MAQPFGSTSFESVTAPKFRWHRTLIGQNGWCTNSRKSQCNMRPMQWINIFIKFRFNKNVLIKIQLTYMWIVRFVRESRIHVSMCFHSNRTIRCNFVIISFLESFMMYLLWNFSDPNSTVRQILYDIYLIFFRSFLCSDSNKANRTKSYVSYFFLISIVAMYKFTCPAAVFELFIMVSAAIAWSFIQYMKLLAKICTILFLLYFILFPFVLNYWLPFLYYREITKKWLNWMWNFHMWQRIPHTAHTHTSAAI